MARLSSPAACRLLYACAPHLANDPLSGEAQPRGSVRQEWDLTGLQLGPTRALSWRKTSSFSASSTSVVEGAAPVASS